MVLAQGLFLNPCFSAPVNLPNLLLRQCRLSRRLVALVCSLAFFLIGVALVWCGRVFLVGLVPFFMCCEQALSLGFGSLLAAASLDAGAPTLVVALPGGCTALDSLGFRIL